MMTMLLRTIVLLSCLLFPISSFGQTGRGVAPGSDGLCSERGLAPVGNPPLCAPCGLAGEPACPWDPPCAEMTTSNFAPIGGICGRTSGPGGAPVERGARGQPPRPGGTCGAGLRLLGTVNLCVECGRLGLWTCLAAEGDQPCWEAEGVVSPDGRCVRGIASAYDLQGTWKTEARGYRIFIVAEDDRHFTARYTNIANTDIFKGEVVLGPPVTVLVNQYWINRQDLPPQGVYEFTQAVYDHLAGTVKAQKRDIQEYWPAKPWAWERVPN